MRTRRTKPLSLAVGAMLLFGLGGCVGYYGPGYYDPYYGGGYYDDDCDEYGDCDDGYDLGYYDGYYGPFLGGYWANDGFFYYWDSNRRYHRDHGRHFRHHEFEGGKLLRDERGGGHWRGQHREWRGRRGH